MIVIEKLDDLEIETINHMKVELEKFINKEFANTLNLSRLDYLYFPNDFDEAVLKFQIEQDVSERGSTQNEMGTAFGKTMEVEIDGVLKDRIFLRKEILYALFGANDSLRQTALNTIHHELCHVHEHSDLEAMAEFYLDLNKTLNTLDGILNTHAMNVFSEYIVPKMAVSSKNLNEIIDVEFLEQIITYTSDNLIKSVEEFKAGKIDSLNLFGQLQLKTSHFLKVLSTIIGELDGKYELREISSEDKEQLETLLCKYFSKHQLETQWLSLINALRLLGVSYPNWKSVKDIEVLKDCIKKTWDFYGIYLIEDEYGLRIQTD